MILKKGIEKKKTFSKFTIFLYFYFFTSIIIVLILVIAFFKSYYFVNKRDKILDLISKAGRYEYLYLPQIAFKAFKSNFTKLDKLELEIPFDKILILENLRNESILNGALPSAEIMPKIKTKILFNEKEFMADIRLKGDRITHFADKDKSSYKLELDRDQFINGIKKFSIQKPRIRNYVHEWIFHELSNNEGIIKLKYDFIKLSINGEDRGLYVIEEGFGKELIERNKRRNGPIFGLNEDIHISDKNPVFEIYNKNYWQQPKNNLLANIASQKLHDFFDNKLSIEDIFDIDRWAAYFAIVDLTATYHGSELKSVKFYYNPINGLFEPIPFDGHRMKPNFHKYNLNYDNRILIDRIQNPIGEEIISLNWLKKFFYKEGKINQKFYNLYLSYLGKISSENYINDFLNKNLKSIEKINSHIYADYFYYDNIRNYGIGLYYFLIEDFRYQAKNIRHKLITTNKIQLIKINNKYLFKPLLNNYSQLIAQKFLCNIEEDNYELIFNQNINNFENTVLNLNHKPKEWDCKTLILLDKFEKKKIILNIDNLNSDFFFEDFKKKSKNIYLNFFRPDNKELILKNDVVEIDKNIYIPSGFTVTIKPGQKIFLKNKAFIISDSSWNIGGIGKTVVISGEKKNLGGGILIGNTNNVSTVRNTQFSYLSGYDLDKNFEYLILGSINFYQTKVKIINVTFKDIFSEDSVNIFRSEFDIKNVNYNNISSDAIDIDFSNGKINKAYFANIQNDAIDFSGSIANVNNVFFENVNDKIISVGEESSVIIDKVEGLNSFAGIISKDGSTVMSTNIFLDNVKIPFAAYQKKNNYSFPLLEVKNYEIINSLTRPIKDKTANLILDTEFIVMKSKDINSLMYEKNMELIK